MSAGTCRDRDQAISAFLYGFAGEAVVDHVVEHDAAPAVDGGIHLGDGAQRGDDQRNLVPFQHFQEIGRAHV